MAYRKSSLEERFHKSYAKLPNGCWIWIGHTTSNSDPRFRYGSMVSNKKRILAHRFSWTLTHKQHITKNQFICHHCDVPLCVNPTHLFLGDAILNMVDREKKGRGPQGERNWSAKLTEVDIPSIIELHKRGSSQKELAFKFGVSQGAISGVVNKKTWKHITGE